MPTRSKTGSKYSESKSKVYWLSPVGETDDFGDKIGDEIIDAKTRIGPWALMTPASWQAHRMSPSLGLGVGQRYKRQPDGRWLKVEG